MQSLFGGNGSGDPVTRAVAGAPIAAQAGPWSQIAVMAIGGLNAIGFSRVDETMLVTSINGQSVIDASTGEIIYRNRDEDGLDTSTLKGTRLDHPADERFDMAGLFGGGLRSLTDDGWSVEQVNGYSLLHPPGASIHALLRTWDSTPKDATFYVLDRPGEDIRALGFSWTGRTLIVATPSTLMIWGRPFPLKL